MKKVKHLSVLPLEERIILKCWYPFPRNSEDEITKDGITIYVETKICGNVIKSHKKKINGEEIIIVDEIELKSISFGPESSNRLREKLK